MFVPTLVSRVSMPVLCNLQADEDTTQYRQTFRLCLTVNVGLAAGLAFLLYAFSPLVLWMFGRGFVAGRILPAVLLISAVAETVSVPWYQVLCSYGKMWTHLAITSLWSVILLGGTMSSAAAAARSHWPARILRHGLHPPSFMRWRPIVCRGHASPARKRRRTSALFRCLALPKPREFQ